MESIFLTPTMKGIIDSFYKEMDKIVAENPVDTTYIEEITDNINAIQDNGFQELISSYFGFDVKYQLFMVKKKQFIISALTTYPKCNLQVIDFIGNVKYYNINLFSSEDIIEYLFSKGYCYYFAVMLKSAFNRGRICIPYFRDYEEIGHIIWMDDDGICYDINGVFGVGDINKKSIQSFKKYGGYDNFYYTDIDNPDDDLIQPYKHINTEEGIREYYFDTDYDNSNGLNNDKVQPNNSLNGIKGLGFN